MDLNEYQRCANLFDQVPDGTDSIVVPLLGLVGETGELLSEYKRNIRGQLSEAKYPNVESSRADIFPQVVEEELGDILWYVSNLATKHNLSLDEIASKNLLKLGDRYKPNNQATQFFDDQYPEEERIPRTFEVLFLEREENGRTKVFAIRSDGKRLGDQLTDNAHRDDGYRFHDVFHLSYATMLGWSPVTRKLMRVKRISSHITDEVEDGGRSWVFEEAISLLVFEYAKKNNYFEGLLAVDGRLLRDIKNLTAGIEVRTRSRREWEIAIQKGFEIWRDLRSSAGGWVASDLTARTMAFRRATAADIEAALASITTS